MKITIIGNKKTPDGSTLADGGRVRVNLYYEILKLEKFDVNFIELQGWKNRLVSLVFSVRKAIKNSDVVLIMGGPFGARFLTKLVLLFNRKRKTRVVMSMLGIGPIQQKISHLNPEQLNNFITNKNTQGIQDKHMGKLLSKLDMILAQNDIILNLYQSFYSLSNVKVLNNFRMLNNRPSKPSSRPATNGDLRLIFFSRVNAQKGVFHIIEAVKSFNSSSQERKIRLDIFGVKQFSFDEEKQFELLLDNYIRYLGVVENKDSVSTFSQYDFSVFPSRYPGEGTPGAIIESLLAGTPVLTSDFSQAKLFIKHEHNGIIYQNDNLLSLLDSLSCIMSLSSERMFQMKIRAYEFGDKFDYNQNRDEFLNLIIG